MEPERSSLPGRRRLFDRVLRTMLLRKDVDEDFFLRSLSERENSVRWLVDAVSELLRL